MGKTIGFLIGALFASIGVGLPTAALAANDYDLMVMHLLDDGQQGEMPNYLGIDFFDCLHAKKKVQIGRKFPPGLLIGADGKSPGGTIIGARCVQRIPKMGQ